MKSGIIIYWENTQEILEFDFTELESITKITKSTELCDSGEKYSYSINPQLLTNEGGKLEVEIKYIPEDNPEICSDEVCWGTSRITIEPNSYTGKAEWVDDNNGKYNGTVRWVSLNMPLKSKSDRRRITATKLERQQIEFRKLLMHLDEKCVLTGESVKTVLEAAHIIPVSEGGPDIPTNGIILRCDLHKLYDSGAFVIQTNGTIKVLNNECGDYYLSKLQNARLTQSTLDRVIGALIEKEA